MRRGTTLYGLTLAAAAGLVFCLSLPLQSRAQSAKAPEAPKLVPKTAAEAKKMVVLANRMLANEGVLDAMGHVSLRNPENPNTFFQARALAPIEVTEDDIIELDLEGNVVSKPAQRPYGERFIHSAILKARPDMNAVFHGHQSAVIPFTITNIPLRPISHLGSFLYQGAPVYEDYGAGTGMLINTKAEGERIAKHLGQYRVQLLRAHGCNIVGETLPRLVASAIYIGVNATVQSQTIAMGKEPKYLDPKEAKEAMEGALLGDSPLSRMWGHWTARAKMAFPDLR